MTERHIIPFGGLRPTPHRVHPIVSYVLEVAARPRARVCVIATATGDAEQSLNLARARLPAERTWVTFLGLFQNRTVTDITEFLCDQDVIWVGGGNTASALAVWRAHGVDVALRAAWEAGVVLTGGSAGSLCWFACGTTDSFGLDRLEPLHDGLGFLPGSHCPHYDGEEQRRPLYHELVAGGFPAGLALDDDAAAHFVGTEIVEVVSAREGATGYRVELAGGEVVETPLKARALG